MTKRFDILKCKDCTNVVEIIDEGIGEIECCKETMEKQEEHIAQINTPHYAVIDIDKIDSTFKKVKLNHEMTQEHYIKMIEIISNDGKYSKKRYLKPSDIAEINLKCTCKEGYYVRVYCSKDGLWVTK